MLKVDISKGGLLYCGKYGEAVRLFVVVVEMKGRAFFRFSV